ncbi:MAG: YlbF family regulator [Acetatifactor sp.]|nr:YlbF family regulator [Acetatifactor sp.]
MNNVDEAVKQLIEAILNSETYARFDIQRNLVKQVPGLKEQIDEFRRRNYEFQNNVDYDFAKLDQFEKEYEDFRENPLVSDFLAADLAFCRLIQEINIKITAAINYE